MATDFEMYAGDTREIFVDVVDDEGTEVDLTDATVLWRVAKSDWKTNPVPIIQKTSDNPSEIAFGSPGHFVVMLESDDTVGLPHGSYYHEAQVTLADGTIGTVITGKIKILQNLIEPR